MTKKEFIKWLEQFPDHTEVRITKEDGYAVKFTGEYNQFEFIDFKENQFVQENDQFYGKAILTIGDN